MILVWYSAAILDRCLACCASGGCTAELAAAEAVICEIVDDKRRIALLVAIYYNVF